jgi:phosphomannomutase
MHYQCPGQSHPIDRAAHLGRLAAFHPECRNCVHRTDTSPLPTALVEQLHDFWKGDVVGARFTAGGVEGIHRNQIAPSDVRRLASALASYIRSTSPSTTTPRIVISGDSRPIVPELIVAAAEGLRWAGCHVLDVGTGTAGSTGWAIEHLDADGGMFIGNARTEQHYVTLKFWGDDATQLSMPGALTRLQKLLILADNRPTRCFGPLERIALSAAYLETLSELFHALRPLRFVLDTSCQALVGWLHELLRPTACRMTHVQAETERAPSPAPRSVHKYASLAHRVVADHAHFGMWIDGNGEAFQLVDEQGHTIAHERAIAALDDETHDALATLAQWLTLLSRSDRAASQAVANTLVATSLTR